MRVMLLLLLYLQLFSAERIIAMSPSVSEIVFALGYGKELVGVSSYAQYPKEVQTITKIGGYFQPNLERIVALKPTLVIGQPHHKELLNKLHRLHINTLEVSLETLDGIKSSIATVAKKLGAHDKENMLLKSIKSAIKKAKKSSTTPKVLLMFGLKERLDSGTYVADENIFYNDILEVCHAQNAYTNHLNMQPLLYYEHIIAAEPDIIIVFHYPLTDGAIDKQKAKKMYASIPTPASKKGNIFILQKDYLAIPSHRVAQTITTLCDVISSADD